MKKYENPMLQVVSIKHNDIITDSQTMTVFGNVDNGVIIAAPGRERDFNSWYEGF